MSHYLIKFAIFSIFLLNSIIGNTIEISKSFSIREKAQIDNYSRLIIVNNNEGIIREMYKNLNQEKYLYTKIPNGCYDLINDIKMCFEDEKLVKISGNIDFLQNNFKDEFFNEKTEECNNFKFNIIKNYLIERKRFQGLQYQIYYLGYFDILRFFIIRDEFDSNKSVTLKGKNLTLRAFVVSSNNDVSCSPFENFGILDGIEIEEKNIKTEEDKIKFGYNKMMLANFKQINPIANNKEKNILIKIQNSYVKKLNIFVLDDELSEISIMDY